MCSSPEFLLILLGGVILAVIEGVGISINRAVSEGYKPGDAQMITTTIAFTHTYSNVYRLTKVRNA